jgi:hypothetical protein
VIVSVVLLKLWGVVVRYARRCVEYFFGARGGFGFRVVDVARAGVVAHDVAVAVAVVAPGITAG